MRREAIIRHLHTGYAQGFTLVELLVTMTIAAILMVLAVPSYTGTIARTKTRGLATELSMTLARARSEALSRNAPVVVTAKAGGWNAGWTTNEVGTTGPYIEERGALAGVSVAGAGTVTYTASGRISGTPPVFLISSPAAASAAMCVSIDLSGRTYSRKGASC